MGTGSLVRGTATRTNAAARSRQRALDKKVKTSKVKWDKLQTRYKLASSKVAKLTKGDTHRSEKIANKKRLLDFLKKATATYNEAKRSAHKHKTMYRL